MSGKQRATGRVPCDGTVGWIADAMIRNIDLKQNLRRCPACGPHLRRRADVRAKVARVLLDEGAHAYLLREETGATAPVMAVETRQAETLHFLIEHGSSLDTLLQELCESAGVFCLPFLEQERRAFGHHPLSDAHWQHGTEVQMSAATRCRGMAGRNPLPTLCGGLAAGFARIWVHESGDFYLQGDENGLHLFAEDEDTMPSRDCSVPFWPTKQNSAVMTCSDGSTHILKTIDAQTLSLEGAPFIWKRMLVRSCIRDG